MRIVEGVVVLLLVLAVGCTPAADTADPAPSAVEATTPEEVAADRPSLRMAVCEPTTLLPGDNLEVCGAEVLAQVFTPLVRYDRETGEAVPAAAASITSEDQVTWTIRLRDDGRFHDGTPVTAASFADAWDLTVADGLTTATYLDRIQGWQAVADGEADHLAGVEVLDDLTLVVTLDRPFSQLPLLLGFNPFFPLPPSVLDRPASATRQVVGNGPFAIDSRSSDGMRLTAVADHQEGTPAVGAVELTWAGKSEGLALLEGDQVDIAAVPPDAQLGGLEAGLVASDGVALQYLAFPLDRPPYDDRSVREALSLAIDRAALVQQVLAGAGRPATGLIPPAAPGSSDVACAVCRHDPDRARTLLADAGVEGPLVVSGAFAEAVAAQWTDILGLEVTVGGDGLDGLRDGTAEGPVAAGWFLDYVSPQNVLEPLFTTGGPANPNGFGSGDVDALITTAGSAGTPEEAVAAYVRAQEAVLRDVPVTPLVFDRRLVVGGPAVDRLVLDRLGQVSLREVEPA